jgi:hypothetical protein
MNIVSSITLKCRDLVQASGIAAEDKRVMEGKLDQIEKLLDEDRFAAQRCIYSGLPRFQNMLHHAQLLHDFPSTDAFTDVVGGSDGIIEFLVGKKTRPVSTVPAGAE